MKVTDIPKQLLVPAEVRNGRLKKCLECPHLTGLWQCEFCLCFVHLKTWVKNEQCEWAEHRQWDKHG